MIEPENEQRRGHDHEQLVLGHVHGEEHVRERVDPAAGRPMIAGVWALMAVFLLTSCGDYPWDRVRETKRMTGGDPDCGKRMIRRYGCGACHTIPGVPGANAMVGPSLDRIASRTYLAGRLTNSPSNMLRWIREPQSVDPYTAMPNMAVTEPDGRDIAAYLYTLK